MKPKMGNTYIGAMRFHKRKSAAQLNAGAFAGEVKGLSPRATRVHLVVLVVFLVLFFMGARAVLVTPYWEPRPAAGIVAIEKLVFSGRSVAEKEIHLPYRTMPWIDAEHQDQLQASFLYDSSVEDNSALFIPIHFHALTVSLNGERLLPQHTYGANPLAVWRRASFFLLPRGLLKQGTNILELKLLDSSQLSGLSKIYVGPHLSLQTPYERRRFVSFAILWVMVVGALLATVAAVALRYAGGKKFLLTTIPFSLLIVLHAAMQFSSSGWFHPSLQVYIWYIGGLSIAASGLLVSHKQWRNHLAFQASVLLLLVASVGLLLCYQQGLVDVAGLSWLAAFVMAFVIFVMMSALLGTAIFAIYKEESGHISPFLAQVLQSRLIVFTVAGVLVLSMLGVARQVPMDFINTAFVVMPINALMVALISAVARTQNLLEFRTDLETKLQEQERQLSLLNYEHLEAMRWSVIGQSTQMLVQEIEAPLERITHDLNIIRLDDNFHRHSDRWHRLKQSVERCTCHVHVIKSLIKEDDMHLTSFRMDGYVNRCMTSIQASYPFEWSLHTSIRGWIEADEHYLYCVLENIIDNAHHSAQAAGRELVLHLNLSLEGDYLRLCVQDNGTGISNCDDVFQPFHTSKAFGLGLGVNLAQKYLNGMGGFLSLEPCDFGAMFCVHLPKGSQDTAG
ncbi:MAG: ATP-binding protein [Granulosicoccaceae bacterium]